MMMLVVIACGVGSLISGGSPLFLVVGILAATMAIVFFIQGIINSLRKGVNTHRTYRQAVDDERIRKFHEYEKKD